MVVISSTLSSRQQQQSAHLSRQHQISELIADTHDLHSHLSGDDSSLPITFADQLTALSLQLRAYNAALQLPIQLQLDNSNSTSEATRSRQVASLENLIMALESRYEDLAQDISDLEPEILDLQGEFQEAQAEFSLLTLNRNIAQETYQSLARTVDEERITAEDMTRGIRLASRAAVPNQPVGSRVFAYSVIVALFVFALAVLIISIINWIGSGAGASNETNLPEIT